MFDSIVAANINLSQNWIRNLHKYIPRKSLLRISKETHLFPSVSGSNLNRKELEFPKDFSGILNLLIVPFKQHQQLLVNTWIPVLNEIEAKMPGFAYYELPTISELPNLSRMFINEGMRAGIPDAKAREKTITLYIDKRSFKSALNIPHEDDITLFLVDAQGNIFWRTTGGYSPEKADELVALCRDLLADGMHENPS
jgi:hypothetical protein